MKELDKLMLHGLRFYGCHGVYPEEKKHGQWFEVDVEVWGDFSRAAADDDLQETLDYEQVFKIAKQVLEGESANIIEHLAYRIINELLLLPPVKKALVRIKKPGAPLGGQLAYAGVEMTRWKDEH
ncbi:MAG: dihydroneopterin aldolase [Peptococcaceae bacterium]|jgi:dihydroneopterin aldolase|nr:dihydroneopterin aldolase [Peptococcaceae bacterium]MDH7523699.1 dihydroneopterin aldolase [Peptococcaceae bacterium]